MSRQEVRTFVDTFNRFRQGDGRLSENFDQEIAAALQSLIDSAVETERESCALVAESVAEPEGSLSPGEVIQVDQTKQKICLEIAQRIRERGGR